MHRPALALASLTALGLASVWLLPTARAAPLGDPYTLVGWNDLGMHCMDSNYELFSVLPPYNTICAHLVDQDGDLVTSPGGITVTYQAVADPTGSINESSIGKTDFWVYVADLFGVTLAPDQGLAGNDMPGAANVPQPMHFVPERDWFTAEGIPVTPFDDAGKKNRYPMMRLEARNAQGALLASTEIVLPVSDEMDCRACHASGGSLDAMPAAGWAGDADYERDYRLNVLKLHDERQAGDPLYTGALATLGFDPGGLHPTAVQQGRPILCAACHASNALPGTGVAGISPLTAAVHGGHADVIDPITDLALDALDNRSGCYRCHPGSETRCLRGAMGAAVAADGALAMQCQSCHGDMSAVGDPARSGWLEEPNCQQCHTGTATHNNGQIRYTSVFEPDGSLRVPVDATFATDPNEPAPGFSLYRFSNGHGGLQCSACHGSTHAIYPSAHLNDNLQSLDLQGHEGTLSDCTACHAGNPDTETGGPHGMHPVGQVWVEGHKDPGNHDPAQCRACHGTDYRGSVLSRALGDRTLNTEFGQKHFWRGFQIGCYDCHQGPSNEHDNSNHAPVAQDAQATTPAAVPVPIALSATDADNHPLTLRVVKQPHHGTVALTGTQATYYPEPGFAGPDAFTFAARDGQTDSNLATVDLSVTANWANFGEGHPGTLGVPGLTAGAVPSLGGAVPLVMENSAGQPTFAYVLVGELPTYQPVAWGGVLLVQNAGWRYVTLQGPGITRTWHAPDDPSWIGRELVLQLLVRDPGASGGFAFSRGLRLTVGE